MPDLRDRGMLLLGAAGLIHLLPLAGLAGASGLAALYGIEAPTPDLMLLLRHRALLFGLLGAALLLAAFDRRRRSGAIGAGLLSTGGFLLLAGDPSRLGEPLLRIWWADVVAFGCLVMALPTLKPRGRGRCPPVTDQGGTDSSGRR